MQSTPTVFATIDLYDFLVQKFPNTATFNILKEHFESESKPSEIGKDFKITQI